MTAQHLSNITKRAENEVSLWVEPLLHTFERFDISTPVRKEMFLAQIALESNGFRRLEENLNYSANRLLQVFPKYYKTLNDALKHAGKPVLIANTVYASRMGNGDAASGDGYKYRGRGLKQLTGKWNYEQCSKGLDIDIVNEPDLLLQPEYAALSAGWFWKSNDCNSFADKSDFTGLTRRINGGLNGLKDREIYLARAKAQKL